MPATYTIHCPECRTPLKSSRPIPAGKLLECPKCQVLFAAPAPRAKPKPQPDDDIIEDVEVVEDVEVIEDVEVVDDEPARPAARAGARRGGPPPRPARAGRKPAADDVGFEVVDDEDEEEARPRPRPK